MVPSLLLGNDDDDNDDNTASKGLAQIVQKYVIGKAAKLRSYKLRVSQYKPNWIYYGLEGLAVGSDMEMENIPWLSLTLIANLFFTNF